MWESAKSVWRVDVTLGEAGEVMASTAGPGSEEPTADDPDVERGTRSGTRSARQESELLEPLNWNLLHYLTVCQPCPLLVARYAVGSPTRTRNLAAGRRRSAGFVALYLRCCYG